MINKFALNGLWPDLIIILYILLTLEDFDNFLQFIRIAKDFKSKRLRLQLGGDFRSWPHYCEISQK